MSELVNSRGDERKTEDRRSREGTKVVKKKQCGEERNPIESQKTDSLSDIVGAFFCRP